MASAKNVRTEYTLLILPMLSSISVNTSLNSFTKERTVLFVVDLEK